MADLSLDELIRQRGLNTKGLAKRPMFGRGAGGGIGRTFDARQKIGAADVRQRLGTTTAAGGAAFQVKDAREKIGQKDARFRIRGRGGAAVAGGRVLGGVQDARQMINSRKLGPGPSGGPQAAAMHPSAAHLQMHVQQIHIQNSAAASANARQFPSAFQGLGAGVGVGPQLGGGPKRVMDARDRLSLKRSIGGRGAQTLGVAPLKITKTIQQRTGAMAGGGIRVNMPVRGAQSLSGGEDVSSAKQMKITTANNLVPSRPGTLGSSYAMAGPITKVVKNDTYTAPPPPAPAAPPRSAPGAAPALQPVSRTLVTGQTQHGGTGAEANAQPAPPQPTISPLEGTKITVNNLHPRVTEEDIVELFCVCGALKRARLVKVGVAEVVFVKKDDAVSAYRKYNNRCLDGQPMKCNLHIHGNLITSEQPILLRLSDSPGASGGGKKEGLPPSLSRPGGRPASSQPTPEVDPQTILKALFKSSPQTTSATAEPPSSQSTAFRIKI